MAKNPGIIYDIGNGKYGLALNKDQHPQFKSYGKVFMRMYEDIMCTKECIDVKSGKKLISVKHINEIRQVGYQD